MLTGLEVGSIPMPLYRHHSHALEDAACNDDQDPMIIASMIIGNEVNNAMTIVKYEHFTIMLIVR